MKHKQESGFTLVEVLIVMITLAIIVSLIAFTYTLQQRQSRDDKRRADIMALQHELDNYYEKYGNYPISCNYGTETSTNCTTLQTAYTTAFPSSSPDFIGKQSTVADIKQILPGLSDKFGDPRNDTGLFINQHASTTGTPIQTNSYFILSLDALTQNNPITISTNLHTSSYATCTYSTQTTNYKGESKGTQPYPYIVGYFSEVDRKWILFHGPKLDSLNDLRWNITVQSACATQ